MDNTRWEKVQSDPMLIFLSGNRPLTNRKSSLFHVFVCVYLLCFAHISSTGMSTEVLPSFKGAEFAEVLAVFLFKL